MIYTIPGIGEIEIKTIILDLNGTLSVGGIVPDGVQERLKKLKSIGFNVLFLTGNTRDDAEGLAKRLGIDWKLAKNAREKREI